MQYTIAVQYVVMIKLMKSFKNKEVLNNEF